MQIPAADRPWEHHLETAVKAARAAGKLQMEAFNQDHQVRYKSENDLVTEVDHTCEQKIVQVIREAFPSHDFLLEESSPPLTGSPYLWVVDPLDGTTNYAHRVPHFCCCIALRAEGQTVVGAVFDPFRNELFTGMRAAGAFLNGRPMRVSGQDRLDRSLIGTGFPREIRTAEEKNLRKFESMLFEVQSIRRSGSAGLDLCYLAAGRLDGYWVVDLEPWDAAAGVLLVEEAGGRVTDPRGNPYKLDRGGIMVTNGSIHGPMLEVLLRAG